MNACAWLTSLCLDSSILALLLVFCLTYHVLIVEVQIISWFHYGACGGLIRLCSSSAEVGFWFLYCLQVFVDVDSIRALKNGANVCHSSSIR